jgi:hypothetical protein
MRCAFVALEIGVAFGLSTPTTSHALLDRHHMTSGDFLQQSTRAKRLRAGETMSYGKAVLAFVALIGCTSTALAIEENAIKSALEDHMCPYPPFNTMGLPNFHKCDPLQPDQHAVQECQNNERAFVCLNAEI